MRILCWIYGVKSNRFSSAGLQARLGICDIGAIQLLSDELSKVSDS